MVVTLSCLRKLAILRSSLPHFMFSGVCFLQVVLRFSCFSLKSSETELESPQVSGARAPNEGLEAAPLYHETFYLLGG